MIFDPLLSIILSFIKNICQAKNTPSPKVLSFDTLFLYTELYGNYINNSISIIIHIMFS